VKNITSQGGLSYSLGNYNGKNVTMTKIIDNFLDQEEFDLLRNFCLNDLALDEDHPPTAPSEQVGLPWYYTDRVVGVGETTGRFQFVHIFYERCNQLSPYLARIMPILDRVQPIAMYRIKANLLTRAPNIIEHSEDYHLDFPKDIPNLNLWATSIFYVNTNNGYTKLKDGTIIVSVANRFVTFPANTEHFGVSCTDEKIRVVINFNYISPMGKMEKYEKRIHQRH
jgi:hypothetical protein